MYTVTDLADLFNTSRNTIYSKLKSSKIKEFVVKTEKGSRLKKEGLNTLQLLMSESKVNVNLTQESVKDKSYLEIDEFVNFLKVQIDEFKQERLDWKKEKAEMHKKYDAMVEKYDAVVGVILEQQKQQLLLESEKNRPFWKKLFFKTENS